MSKSFGELLKIHLAEGTLSEHQYNFQEILEIIRARSSEDTLGRISSETLVESLEEFKEELTNTSAQIEKTYRYYANMGSVRNI